MGFFDGKKVNEKSERTPQPVPGRHLLIIDELSIFNTREHGECPQIKAYIKESNSEPVGKRVGKIYFLHSGASEMARSYTRGDFLAFGRALQTSLGSDGEAAEVAQIDDLLASLYYHPPYVQNQQARGIALWCDSVQASKDGQPMTTKGGQPVINLTFHGFSQSAEDIAAARAWCEEQKNTVTAMPQAPAAPPQPPATPVAAVPAPIPSAVPAAVTAPPVAPVAAPPVAPVAVPASVPEPVPPMPAMPAATPAPAYQAPVGKQSVLDKLGIG